ncbi:MAG: ATP-binding protein, partial [bacterium]
MKNTIELLIDDFHERALPELLPREASVPRMKGKANVIIGMRRSGKTWFCYQQMKELLERGVEKEGLLYIDFEDERLLPFSTADFQSVLEVYYRKFPLFKNRQCHLFLDEVQRIDGWDKFIRRVLDTERLSVFVTGSSSRLLSAEIATSLRGRSLTTEIFPLSFKEFVCFNEPDFRWGRLDSKTRALLQNLAGKYMEVGGFPEVQAVSDELRHQVLQNYVDVVILRDVIERYSVGNTVALRALIRHIMSAPATRFSVSKFYNALRSRGIACTKNSLYDYLGYLADAYLIYEAPIHSRSEKARQVNPRKIYVIDQGLLKAMSFYMTEDRGALLENVVYMHLRRSGLKPDYYVSKDGLETDFILPRGKTNDSRIIQVCWDIADPLTREREIKALLSAMGELNEKRGTLITWMDE